MKFFAKRLMALYNRFQPTDKLLNQLRNAGNGTALSALDALKERVAHKDGTLSELDLSGASLSKATLATADLKAIDFTAATLEHAYFANANLENAIFRDTTMTFANLRGATVKNATFENANLTQANFARADLSGVNFQNANLSQANFWETILIGVNLTGAIMLTATLSDVHCDESTILPDGTNWSVDTNWAQFTEKSN